MTLFTIGFTHKTAEVFFTLLRNSGVRRVIDIRLNNRSQLAGFAKKEDLRYFCAALGGIDYVHLPSLAPTQELLDSYKKQKGTWENFERAFRAEIRERHIERDVSPGMLESACLLCSEPGPERCHRRLVAEYLQETIGGLTICHL